MLGCIYARAFAASCVDSQNYTNYTHTLLRPAFNAELFFTKKNSEKLVTNHFTKTMISAFGKK